MSDGPEPKRGVFAAQPPEPADALNLVAESLELGRFEPASVFLPRLLGRTWLGEEPGRREQYYEPTGDSFELANHLVGLALLEVLDDVQGDDDISGTRAKRHVPQVSTADRRAARLEPRHLKSGHVNVDAGRAWPRTEKLTPSTVRASGVDDEVVSADEVCERAVGAEQPEIRPPFHFWPRAHRPLRPTNDRTVRPMMRRSRVTPWWRRYQNSYWSFSMASMSEAP